MTDLPLFIGDEAEAAGFRLCGVRTLVPRPGEEAAVLEYAREEAGLVLVSACCAARVPATRLAAALATLSPLVLVVPEARGRVAPPDLEREVRALLGLEP